MTKNTVAQIEKYILSDKKIMELHTYRGGLLDAAIHAVAEKTNMDTLFDIVPKKGHDLGYDMYSPVEWDEDNEYVRNVREIVKHTLNVDAVVNSSRNLLATVVGADWKDSYKKAVAELLIKEGRPVSVEASYYGWGDYELERHILKDEDYKPVAVLEVQEETWGEFEGTFYEGDTSHHGIVGAVVLKNGYCCWFRYETDMGNMLKKLFKL